MFKKVLCGILVLCLSLGVLAGCGDKKEEGGVVELSWYLMGDKKDSSYDHVWEEFNKIMEEKYGIRINFVMTDYGNFGQKIQMMNASQEDYDLVFTSHSNNPFHTNIANGSLYDLTELLPEYAPELYASLSEAEKAAVTIDGRIYAVPNWQMQSYSTGFWFVEDWLKEAGFTLDDFNTLEDIEPFLKKMTEIDPNRNIPDMNFINTLSYYGMVSITQDSYPGVVYFNKEGKPKVVNQYETKEFEHYAKLVRSWVEKGYLRDVYDKPADNYMHKDINRSPAGICRYMPGTAANFKRVYENDYAIKPVGDSIITSQGLLACCTGVGAFSKHPEEAVKVLEIMYTDKELYNMLVHGIEGENYDFVGDNLIHIKEDSTYKVSHWQIGSALNTYVDDRWAPDNYIKEKELDSKAKTSPLVGFTADTTSILGQLGNCETVIKERYDSIDKGLVDPDKALPEFRKALKTAGVDEVIAELQRQVDEWWENR